jgi:hypothetical protein
MPTQIHDATKAESAKPRRRDPRARTVAAVDHNFFTPDRCDLAGSRSDFVIRNVDRVRNVPPIVLLATADVDDDRSVGLPETLSELGRTDPVASHF